MDASNDSVQRLMAYGQALVEIDHYEQAEREFRQALAKEPNDARLHLWLALVLTARTARRRPGQARPELDEALREARLGVHLAPEFAFAHATHASVLLVQHKEKQALPAIQQAIRLDAASSSLYAILARVYLRQDLWREQLAAANQGLQCNPGDIDCINLRFLALVQLGRMAEGEQALEWALSCDAANAFTHANMGWLRLHQRRYEEAMQHYREALRLDPMSEWARYGIAEAMRARHVLYRPLLAYSLFMGRLTSGEKVGLFYGLSGLNSALRIMARAFPPLYLIVLPWMLFVQVWVFFSWTGRALFNLLLRMDRLGRMALTEDEIKASNWIAVCLGGIGLCLAAALVLRRWEFLVGAAGSLIMMMPVAGVFDAEPGKRRNALAGCASLLGLTALCSLATALYDPALALAPVVVLLVGWYIYSWVASLILISQ